MKPTTIQFEYDDAKLEAIRICLADKQTDLNHELEAFMDSTYKKIRSRSGAGFHRKEGRNVSG